MQNKFSIAGMTNNDTYKIEIKAADQSQSVNLRNFHLYLIDGVTLLIIPHLHLGSDKRSRLGLGLYFL